MPQRELSFTTYNDALAELDRLQRGYAKAGNWDLAQVCDHLRFFIDGSMDGHRFKVPWIFKAMFGRMVLKRILGQRKMKSGVFTPQKPLPTTGGDEAAAVAKLRASLARARDFRGDWHDSPFFGHLTPEQWHELHLIHCAHHLGYLEPKS